MKKILLKNTNLSVSRICLGTVHFGTLINENAAKVQLNRFTELGGNFVDTTHVYGDWVPGIKGRSERVIGAWLKKTGMRHKTIISTKGAHPDFSDMNTSRAIPKEIVRDLDESLQNLDTDYIDLYFLHRDNPAIPVEELLGVLEQARKQGKILYYGCSNWALSRVKQAHRHEFSGFVCNQLMYSLADINANNIGDETLVMMDRQTYAYHTETELNSMAYTSLAKGYFTKKTSGQAVPENISKIYSNPSNEQILGELIQIARKLQCTLAELELSFLMHQDFPVVPIVSFSNMEQMEQGMKSSDLSLDSETVKKLRGLKKYLYQ